MFIILFYNCLSNLQVKHWNLYHKELYLNILVIECMLFVCLMYMYVCHDTIDM